MFTEWTFSRGLCKACVAFIALVPLLAACSTNQATGRSQFAGLMSESQEAGIGASEHEKIGQEYGFYKNAALNAYVREVADKVTKNTERADIRYQVFIVDSPIVNAFALPGGYLYVSRGLLALANSEAELAGVLAHETGHVTARHSAERYSHGVLTSLGGAILSAAVNAPGLSDAIGVGSNLYLSSYSRKQESEADSLGLRYMSRAGYDASQMSAFLASLEAETALEKNQAGQGEDVLSGYFSTHPATAERVSSTYAESKQYPPGGAVNHDRHLQMIDGLTYGDSDRQGFVRGGTFYHTDLGFAFDVPDGFEIQNQSNQVAAAGPGGSVMLFDIVQGSGDAGTYLSGTWLKGEGKEPVDNISINGMPAATTSFAGSVNNRPATIRLIAIDQGQGSFARFQMAVPQGAPASVTDSLKKTTYSFRRLNDQERKSIHPDIVRIVKAGAGDSVSSLAGRQSLPRDREEWFRVLNGMKTGQQIIPGQLYKIIIGG